MRFSLSIGLCLGLFASAFGAIQKGAIEVGALQGPADLLNKEGKRAPLTRGLVFQEGKRVETQEKSTAELILSNGSTIKVNPNTLMEVKAFSQVSSPLIVPGKYAELSAEPSPSVVQIEVYRGKIDGEVRKLNPNTQYTIKTPVGVVRVRGTILSVSYTEDKNGRGCMLVTCTTGSVLIRSNDNKSSLTLGPGEKQEVVGTPDNIVVAPNKPADINSDGIPDVPVDTDGDGKADGVDVNGDGKIDKLVSGRADGQLDGIDTDGDGKIDSKIDIDGDGVAEIAIDGNSDGIPEAVVTIDELFEVGGRLVTPLIYPPIIYTKAYNPDGSEIEVVPYSPLPSQDPPRSEPTVPTTNNPPANDETDRIIQKEVQEQISPSGG